MWLFKRDTSAPLEGVKLRSGLAAEWDSEFPLGLAIVVPSGVDISDEENKYAFNVHFCGRHNLLKKFNVIFHHGNHYEKSRTDKRIKARCYFRIRTFAAPESTITFVGNTKQVQGFEDAAAGSAANAIELKSDVTEHTCVSCKSGAVHLPTGTSFLLQNLPRKKLKARSAMDAFKDRPAPDDKQPHVTITMHSKRISEQLMVAVAEENKDSSTENTTSATRISNYLTELHEDAEAHQAEGTSPSSVIAPTSWSEASSPMVPPLVRQPMMNFTEALAATVAKGKESASLEVAAMTFPVDSFNRAMLFDKAREAKIEAVKIMNAAKF